MKNTIFTGKQAIRAYLKGSDDVKSSLKELASTGKIGLISNKTFTSLAEDKQSAAYELDIVKAVGQPRERYEPEAQACFDRLKAKYEQHITNSPDAVLFTQLTGRLIGHFYTKSPKK